ncbi:MAG: hypothetical protein AVDCRST_MAG73-2537, partial [uncultured Thermomicrobiales bacterium]
NANTPEAAAEARALLEPGPFGAMGSGR